MNALLPTDTQPVSQVQDLLALHGESFIRAAYATVLGRPVDEVGLASYLHFLRKGEDPAQMLLILYRSKEAQARKVEHVAGLDEWVREQEVLAGKRRWKDVIRRRMVGLLRPVFHRIAVTDDQVRRLQAQLLMQRAEIEALLSQQFDRLELHSGMSGPASAAGSARAGNAHRDLGRLSRDGQGVYLKLREALNRRDFFDSP
jgi:hypothetical protein